VRNKILKLTFKAFLKTSPKIFKQFVEFLSLVIQEGTSGLSESGLDALISLLEVNIPFVVVINEFRY